MKRILFLFLLTVCYIGNSQVYNHNSRVKIQTVNELSTPALTTEVLVRDTANNNEVKHVSIQDLVGVVGTNTFIGLTDTPSAYTSGTIGNHVRVTQAGTALEFVAQEDIHNFYTESGLTTASDWTSTMGLSTGFPFIKLDKSSENQVQINLGTSTVGHVLTTTGTNGEASWSSLPSPVNIYSTNGNIPTGENRFVDLSSGASLGFRSQDLLTYMFVDDNEIDIRNGQGTIRFRTGVGGTYESNNIGDVWTAMDAFGNGKWQNLPPAITTLPNLTDVTITSPADLEILSYEQSSSNWINRTSAELGLPTLSGANIYTGANTFSGPVNVFTSNISMMNSSRILNLGNGVNANDAVNKGQLDAVLNANMYNASGNIPDNTIRSVFLGNSSVFRVVKNTTSQLEVANNSILLSANTNTIQGPTGTSHVSIGSSIQFTQNDPSGFIRIRPTTTNVSTVGQVLTATDINGAVAWQDLPLDTNTNIFNTDGSITGDRLVTVDAAGSLRFNVGASTIHNMTSSVNEIRGIDINLINTSGSRIDIGTDIEITQGNVNNSIKIQPTSSSISTVGQVLKAIDADGSVAWQDRLPYEVYTALLNQSGTDAPTATVLENTIGSIVWTRSSTGTFIGTLTGAFDVAETIVFTTKGNGAGIAVNGWCPDANQIILQNRDESGLPTEGLIRLNLEIRVYN